MSDLFFFVEQLRAEEARDTGAAFDDILWTAEKIAKHNKELRRRLNFWMSDCTVRVLYIFESRYPEDDRPKKAVEARRAYACEEIDYETLLASLHSAWDSFYEVYTHKYRDGIAGAVAKSAGREFAFEVSREAVNAITWEVVGSYIKQTRTKDHDSLKGIFNSVGRAIRGVEREWQFNRLIEWLGKTEPEPLPVLKET